MTLNMTILLARYYADKHHPLAQGIKPSEITPLVTSLQCRWAEAGVKPELAQEGLEGLRRAATAYAQHAAQRGQPFTEEDHLRIIRELAAFHGSGTKEKLSQFCSTGANQPGDAYYFAFAY